MNAIRIRKHLDSDTLHLPELRDMIGQDVEIVVTNTPVLTDEAGREFWRHRTLDELAAAQGYVPRTFEELLGPFSAEEFEGFEDFLEKKRRSSVEQG